MANIDLSGHRFVTGDGKMNVDFGALPVSTVVNALLRTCAHVFGNEAISKASTAKAKAGGELPGGDDEYDSIVNAARESYKAAMLAGTWGDKGERAPRAVGAGRPEQIFNTIAGDDTRKALAKEGKKVGTAKNTWIADDGNAYPLADWMNAFLTHPELGADRKASIERRAKIQHEAELAEAAERKAAKERESKVAKGSGLSL